MINELRSYILNDPKFGELVAFPDQYGMPVRLNKTLSEIRSALIGDDRVDDKHRAWVATNLVRALYRDRDAGGIAQSIFDTRVSFLDQEAGPDTFDSSITISGGSVDLIQTFGNFTGYPGVGIFNNRWDITHSSSSAISIQDYATGENYTANMSFTGTTGNFVEIKGTSIQVRLIGVSQVPVNLFAQINGSVAKSFSLVDILNAVTSVQGVEDLVYINEKEIPDIPFLYSSSQDRIDRKLWSIILAYGAEIARRR